MGVILFPLLTVSRFCVQINFRCKPSFREPGCRAVREVSPICPKPFHLSRDLCYKIGKVIGSRSISHQSLSDLVTLVLSVQRRATPLGPQEAPDGEVSTVRQGECAPNPSEPRSAQTSPRANRVSCRQQGFQQKFSFHSKEIVAISCSWCKQAVSPTNIVQERRCGNQPGGSTPKPRPRFKSVRGRGRSTTDVKEELDFKDGVHSTHPAHTANIFWLPGLLPGWATTKYQENREMWLQKNLIFCLLQYRKWPLGKNERTILSRLYKTD